MTPGKALAAALAAPVLAGTAVLSYALVHAHAYKLRRRTVLLPHPDRSDAQAIRILHISDPHLLVKNKKRTEFIRDLANTDPDLVILTGDLIAEPAAIGTLLDALEPLLDRPGAFVFGSNDYFAPQFRSPLRYLTRNSNEDSGHDKPVRLPTEDLRRGLSGRGWIDANNTRGTLHVNGWDIDIVGVDDPHIDRDVFPAPADPSGELPYRMRIGVTHAPYVRILDRMVNDGCHLVFAGHTHGGQVCLPHRALVTNSDMDTRYASGLFRWPVPTAQTDGTDHARPETPADTPATDASDAGARDSDEEFPIQGDGAILGWDPEHEHDGSAIVQISAGLGTSPFTPIRTFCAPEAIQMDVVPL